MGEVKAFKVTPVGQLRTVKEMADRYRRIRESQPAMTEEEMRAQLVRNRAKYAERNRQVRVD